MNNEPSDIELTSEMLRTVVYVLLATSSADLVKRLATSFASVATWPQLQPATRALVLRLSADAETFAAGRPPKP